MIDVDISVERLETRHKGTHTHDTNPTMNTSLVQNTGPITVSGDLLQGAGKFRMALDTVASTCLRIL